MLRSLSLQNYRSFGALQTLPLEPLTVLVGPNNSGKSSLLELPLWMRWRFAYGPDPLSASGEALDPLHRPPVGDGSLVVAWSTEQLGYRLRISGTDQEGTSEYQEHVTENSAEHLLASWNGPRRGDPRSNLRGIAERGNEALYPSLRPLVEPFARARFIKLTLSALRSDAQVAQSAALTPEGAGMAALLTRWRGAEPERAEEFDDFLRECIPELKRVLVRAAPTPGFQRISLQQRDGQEFTPAELSDGVMYFLGLAMHALDAPRGALLLLEEPEQCIHPYRLGMLLDLLRKIVRERGCQVLVSTHSPVLLDHFRDEPEAILLFQRTPSEGSRVTRFSDAPKLMEALENSDSRPGAMLIDGFLHDPR